MLGSLKKSGTPFDFPGIANIFFRPEGRRGAVLFPKGSEKSEDLGRAVGKILAARERGEKSETENSVAPDPGSPQNSRLDPN